MPVNANGMTFKLGGDLEVHRLGFGTIRLTAQRGFGPPLPGAGTLLEKALSLGINFIDTADSYGPGHAEDAIRNALHPYPDGLVIATKGGFLHSSVDDWQPDGDPEHLRRACESSLERLKLERIDLYQLHTPDDKVPYAESVGTLKELQAEGKIRHIGLSNVTMQDLRVAQREVEVVSVQNAYNLAYRQSEDVLDFCSEKGIAFIPWMPLAAELAVPTDQSEQLAAVATRYHASVAQVMLAALLHRSPVMIPVPGTGSLEHLVENAAAAELRLDSHSLEHLWA